RDIDSVTGPTVLLVHNAVVRDVVLDGAAFDVVTNHCVMHVAVAQSESAPADVEIVAIAVARSVVGEFGMLDDKVTIAAAAENSILVVMEITVAHCESGAFDPDTGAVAIRDLCTGKLDSFDSRIRAFDDPDRLALGAGTVGAQMYPTTHAADGE